jgi:hypothetical protein
MTVARVHIEVVGKYPTSRNLDLIHLDLGVSIR